MKYAVIAKSIYQGGEEILHEEKTIEASSIEVTELGTLNFWHVTMAGSLQLVAAYAPGAWHDVREVEEEQIAGTGDASSEES